MLKLDFKHGKFLKYSASIDKLPFPRRGAGILLAKMIDDRLIKVADQDILELGSGTGLSGLVSGKMGGRTLMTG